MKINWVRVADEGPPCNVWLWVAGTPDRPGDWCVKLGTRGAFSSTISVMGGSWKPTHWALAELPEPPRS
jgi:hypothetical protein